MAKNNKTLVVITGGTIDAMYSPEEGTPHVVPVPKTAADSCIPAALEKLGLRAQCDVWPLAMKDSKHITREVLDQITQRIVGEGYERVVIMHGTDTMPRNGRYLRQELEKQLGPQHTTRVVMTGAMNPLRDANTQWRGLNADGTPNLEAKDCDGWSNLARSIADTANPKLDPGCLYPHGPAVDSYG
jgi:L-asparaginase/Glu-tRNA(Gln) amidotransferase subunit D